MILTGFPLKKELDGILQLEGTYALLSTIEPEPNKAPEEI